MIDGQDSSSATSLVTSRTSEQLSARKHHKTLTFLCIECGNQWVHPIDCGDRLCPECNRRRSSRVISRYAKLINALKNPKWLTLTLQRIPLGKMAVKKLRSYFRRLRHHKIWDKTAKGIYCIEIGELDDMGCCNLHIHVLMDSGYMDQKELSKAWRRITHTSCVVDIRAAKRFTSDFRAMLRYMTKYMVKFPRDLPEWKAKLYNDTFHGTRLIQAFGLPHGEFQLDIRQPVCPFCGSVDVHCIEFEPNREDMIVEALR